jgi:WD40 repeat protein
VLPLSGHLQIKSSVNCVMWLPDGRRLMTGVNSGEFALWDGRSFTSESMMQAHEAAVRCMRYTHSEHIIISSDDNGRIKVSAATCTVYTWCCPTAALPHSCSFTRTPPPLLSSSIDC